MYCLYHIAYTHVGKTQPGAARRRGRRRGTARRREGGDAGGGGEGGGNGFVQSNNIAVGGRPKQHLLKKLTVVASDLEKDCKYARDICRLPKTDF